MKNSKTVQINDEPYSKNSTGIRSAVINYEGPRYHYFEVSKSQKKIMAYVHSSNTSDLQTALERCNRGNDDLVCVELDAEENLLPICAYTSFKVNVQIPKYTETLPDGTKWEYEYFEEGPLALNVTFDFPKMEFDPETKDFVEVKFKGHSPEETFLQGIDSKISDVTAALEENTYSEEDLEKITAYKDALVQFRADYDGTVKFWKLKIPTLDIPY
jgi:hypothetical protein